MNEYQKQNWEFTSNITPDKFNHMEDGIYNNNKKISEVETNLIKPVYGMAWLKKSYYMPSNNTHRIPLDTAEDMGEGLELSDGGIKITSDKIKYVVVSCKYIFDTRADGTYFIIFKNDATVQRVINAPTTAEFTMNCILPVQKNDIIKMGAYIFSNNTAKSSTLSAYANSLTVLGF